MLVFSSSREAGTADAYLPLQQHLLPFVAYLQYTYSSRRENSTPFPRKEPVCDVRVRLRTLAPVNATAVVAIATFRDDH